MQSYLQHQSQKISIHALREEGDPVSKRSYTFWNHFYPRPPRGGRRLAYVTACQDAQISIHALREEGDLSGRFIFGDFIISIHALREEGDRCRRPSVRRW